MRKKLNLDKFSKYKREFTHEVLSKDGENNNVKRVVTESLNVHINPSFLIR